MLQNGTIHLRNWTLKKTSLELIKLSVNVVYVRDPYIWMLPKSKTTNIRHTNAAAAYI